jgi:hypothetical protein
MSELEKIIGGYCRAFILPVEIYQPWRDFSNLGRRPVRPVEIYQPWRDFPELGRHPVRPVEIY